MYFLLKMGIFQPAMLVYWMVYLFLYGICLDFSWVTFRWSFFHPTSTSSPAQARWVYHGVQPHIRHESCTGPSGSEKWKDVTWISHLWDVVVISPTITRWWFQTFFIFIPTWENDPIWLIFFRWVETTNTIMEVENGCISNISFLFN